MPPVAAVLPLLLFVALLLGASLCALAASGHFPSEHRGQTLRSPVGSLILFGSLALSVACLLAGLKLIWGVVPWYAAVIGGGAAVLATPLLLQPFPDSFVNGRGALLTFAGASLLMTGLLFVTAG